MFCDGIDDVLGNTDPDLLLALTMGNYSVSTWVKFDESGDNFKRLFQIYRNSTYRDLYISPDPNEIAVLLVRNTSSNYGDATAFDTMLDPSYAEGIWIHYAIVVQRGEADEIIFYKNGVNQNVSESALLGAWLGTPTTLEVSGNTDSAAQKLRAAFANFGIINGSLSPEQVEDLYNLYT